MMFLMGCNSDLAQRVEDLEKREVLLKKCIAHITFGIEHTHPLEYPYVYEFADNPKVKVHEEDIYNFTGTEIMAKKGDTYLDYGNPVVGEDGNLLIDYSHPPDRETGREQLDDVQARMTNDCIDWEVNANPYGMPWALDGWIEETKQTKQERYGR